MRPGSGVEGRIWAEFRGKKKWWVDYKREGLPTLYLYLASKWKMPIREIKSIVKRKRDDSESEGSLG